MEMSIDNHNQKLPHKLLGQHPAQLQKYLDPLEMGINILVTPFGTIHVF